MAGLHPLLPGAFAQTLIAAEDWSYLASFTYPRCDFKRRQEDGISFSRLGSEEGRLESQWSGHDSAGSPGNHGPSPTIARAHQPDPNRY